jgi:undecaprenyl diphosphate synthase
MPHLAIIPQAWWPEAASQWPDAERALLARLTAERLPAHIAVIMDGNGRWARGRGFIDRIRGHEAGIEAVREATRTCAQLHIQALTLYAFSKENWQRPRREIDALMTMLTRFLVEERPELMENRVRLRSIGVLDDLPEAARRELAASERLTAANDGLVLNLALSYGGRDEIVRAARQAAQLARRGELNPDQLDENAFADLLDTRGLPEPDLLIRTSGELRVSNFLLWQMAYTEIYVTPVLWPDFRRLHLLEALIDFLGRERRYGRVVESPRER